MAYCQNRTFISTHNWSLHRFSQDHNLASHTTHCIHEWRDLQFNVDWKRQMFCETFSCQIYLLSENPEVRNLLRGYRRKNIFFKLRTTDFLRSFSWQFYLRSKLLPEICWEEATEEIHTLHYCLLQPLSQDYWPSFSHHLCCVR